MSFQPLSPDDVITIDKSKGMVGFNTTNRQSEMVEEIRKRLLGNCNCADDWFTDGVECTMLRKGEKDWTKGRVRLQIQFEPEPKD